MPVFPNFDRFFNLGKADQQLEAYDNKFYIVDNADATKKLNFQLSGVTAATTRTITMPDSDLTLVGADTAQTLTGKKRSVLASSGNTTMTAAMSGAIMLF